MSGSGLLGLLGGLAKELTIFPKVRATHVEDGSVGEVILKWSGDYRVRWYEGPRQGKLEYVPCREVTTREMPKAFSFPA